ncbi:HIRAN domain-containing protein [Bacillus stercoris]|uniref:HIRAN domain-containing protein n=1 Tax=Bacillus stercoris TaxID=2054641 RepID=UPI001455DCA6|nr:HIRAN domain-containing protein [Bacillus stercoris]MDO7346566.1 hypothetical protein [Bacillus stercoris]MEC2110714.1 hypothetical protein [Bacillus stercoris]MEC3617514.1 hypothetical protein [Bacillus stercoris]NLS39910.1 hypothetical protein [Bacillus subtilis]
MGILNFFKNKVKNEQHENRNNSINTVEVNSETEVTSKKENFPILIQETAFSRKYEEKFAFFEYIDFKVAGTSHYQKDIKKAIKTEVENSFFFDEKYDGMTNKEILESTFDEPIFVYHNALFSNCELRLEENNEYDPEAIAVYVNDFKVGHVPRKNFQEGKKYIYDQLKSGIRHPISASLYGGKYKVNRDDTKIETGETDYKIECQIVIKTDK